MPLKKITDIISEIKENLPDVVRDSCRNILIPRNVTAVLENRGLLTRNAGGGRHPTQRGRELGISTEQRTIANTGENYIQVLYNEEAAALVHSFLLEEYPALGYELTVKTAAAGAGIGTEIRIINSSNVAIALVKYQNKYWTHNDSAIRLCEILGIEPFIKADGKPGVAIKCEDFASTFIYALIDSGEDFAINDDRLYIYRRNIRPAALPVDRVETAARIGSAVELRDNQREIIKFYLAKGEVSSPTVITHADGTIEITSTPITEIEGYQIIHPGTPIFDAVIGKGIGERFSCLDCTYEIISVRNDVHLHKPAPLPVHN